jgi:hypothetical protein
MSSFTGKFLNFQNGKKFLFRIGEEKTALRLK